MDKRIIDSLVDVAFEKGQLQYFLDSKDFVNILPLPESNQIHDFIEDTTSDKEMDIQEHFPILPVRMFTLGILFIDVLIAYFIIQQNYLSMDIWTSRLVAGLMIVVFSYNTLLPIRRENKENLLIWKKVFYKNIFKKIYSPEDYPEIDFDYYKELYKQTKKELKEEINFLNDIYSHESENIQEAVGNITWQLVKRPEFQVGDILKVTYVPPVKEKSSTHVFSDKKHVCVSEKNQSVILFVTNPKGTNKQDLVQIKIDDTNRKIETYARKVGNKLINKTIIVDSKKYQEIIEYVSDRLDKGELVAQYLQEYLDNNTNTKTIEKEQE